MAQGGERGFSSGASNAAGPQRVLARIRYFARCCVDAVRTGDWDWAREISRAGCPAESVRVDRSTGALVLDELNFAINRSEAQIVLPCLSAIRQLALVETFQLRRNDADEMIAQVGNIRTVIRTAGDLLVLDEVFGRQFYDLSMTAPVAVWDVGMNVGAASLYFAQKPFVIGVVGYEPFRPTWSEAMENLRLNPALAAKITALNRGIGETSGEKLLPYAPVLKGVLGLDGALFGINNVVTTQERVQIRAAADAVDELRQQFPNTKLVAKLDCEGAEYQILSSLANSGRLSYFNAIMAEWHLKGPEPLKNILEREGFESVSFAFEDHRFGMLYAFHGEAGDFRG